MTWLARGKPNRIKRAPRRQLHASGAALRSPRSVGTGLCWLTLDDAYSCKETYSGIRTCRSCRTGPHTRCCRPMKFHPKAATRNLPTWSKLTPRCLRKDLTVELDLAASHASQIVGWPMPKFVYRHTWKLGDLLMWDSLSTMHRATEFEDGKHRRDMWRTTCRERPVELSAVA
jgi:hypothetical protein